MYFIVMRGESFPTNKIGCSDGVALKGVKVMIALVANLIDSRKLSLQ